MQQHADNGHLQAQATEVLAALCNHGPAAFSPKMLQTGAVDVVLSALRQHKQIRQVQQGAILFLTLLSTSSHEQREINNIRHHHHQNDNNDKTKGDAQAVAAFGGGFAVVETIWQGLFP